jgi:hypothetical protein
MYGALQGLEGVSQVEIRNTVNAWIIVALVLGAVIVLGLLLAMLRTTRNKDTTSEILQEARALSRLPETVSTEMWFAAADQSQRASDKRRRK